MGGERAGDIGRKCDIVVTHRGQERFRDRREVPGWQAAHRVLHDGATVAVGGVAVDNCRCIV